MPEWNKQDLENAIKLSRELDRRYRENPSNRNRELAEFAAQKLRKIRRSLND